jgi:hypothetical protein
MTQKGKTKLTTLTEYTNMLRIRCGAHLKDDILDACSLCSRPMYSVLGNSRWYARQVEDKISYLPEEDICRPPIQVGCIIWIRIDECKA